MTALTDHALLVALLVAVFFICAGASMICTFVTPLAAGFAQVDMYSVGMYLVGLYLVGMYLVGLVGQRMMEDMEHVVSRM
ncbi:uncharacterized protein LMH87_007644 [Akanthomyces muscarius]|uniref:Uncharacterized protein n=1 Tax=Akanthomyces muscarius TaxID=2231603 RepID=A0A9W8QJI9_AKAMU|nr:uncharacterized protein LMH87_007644 [Akanthomyces muscarius]KAJ4161614.1 hypothetical protein LMH87_007644 [Akanthomyces muscarius]